MKSRSTKAIVNVAVQTTVLLLFLPMALPVFGQSDCHLKDDRTGVTHYFGFFWSFVKKSLNIGSL